MWSIDKTTNMLCTSPTDPAEGVRPAEVSRTAVGGITSLIATPRPTFSRPIMNLSTDVDTQQRSAVELAQCCRIEEALLPRLSGHSRLPAHPRAWVFAYIASCPARHIVEDNLESGA